MLTILRRRDFALLWFAGLISLTGDYMLVVALPITVYQLTGSALAMGGILIANKHSALVLGSVAGVFVDRWDRKQTMVVANLVRAPLLLLLVAVDSAERIWIVYLVTFAVATMGQFFRPAENALLPRLLGQDNALGKAQLDHASSGPTAVVALGGAQRHRPCRRRPGHPAEDPQCCLLDACHVHGVSPVVALPLFPVRPGSSGAQSYPAPVGASEHRPEWVIRRE